MKNKTNIKQYRGQKQNYKSVEGKRINGIYRANMKK